ncbi:DNA protecting protein DprA [Tumebacillus sp. BK434]|uniref:DNA-processing protein DprA n=1 Tax=Tumebacillus sp. BK434 TaxID=2512169 RepID=UPI0010478329|nr:DNA-processing protein DprA [Tumebacillus sp. BK434]TCP58807.1 DNA protecting protein DprA [Tumebacillus sp. BK434]
MRVDDILLWLSVTPGAGGVTVRRLYDTFGCWESVWAAGEAEMERQSGVKKQIIRSLVATRASFDPVAVRKQFEPQGVRYVSQVNGEYPQILHTLYDPPAGLFVIGTIPRTGAAALAVVGARTLTAYGRLATERLVTELAASGLTIVSGLARGIDTAAHHAVLQAGGQTIAVLGSGVLQIYPRENVTLAHRIADGHGAVLSEYPPHAPGRPQNFPVRNRIISGLSQATLVVEAGEKSGSLITADQALEQGRDVYAVPGPITSPASAGTNRLIQQGAKLVLSAADLLEDYEFSLPQNTTHFPQHDLTYLPSEFRILFEALGHEAATLDELHLHTGLPLGQLHSTLLRLQLQGEIAALPGNRFLRVKR